MFRDVSNGPCTVIRLTGRVFNDLSSETLVSGTCGPLFPYTDEAKNEPFLGGHLSPELNLFDQILP